MSKIFRVSWVDVLDALVFGLLTGLVVIGTEMIAAKTIWGLDWRTLLNSGVIAFVGVITAFIKTLLTTSTGKFAGVIKIKK